MSAQLQLLLLCSCCLNAQLQLLLLCSCCLNAQLQLQLLLSHAAAVVYDASHDSCHYAYDAAAHSQILPASSSFVSPSLRTKVRLWWGMSVTCMLLAQKR